MKCLILAAGYATRLYPLTENFPKPLLQVGERTILDRLVDDLGDTMSEYIVVSNHKFAEHFRKWAASKEQKITVVDDGTSTNESRLGAVRDMQLGLQGNSEDVLVMAGDNVLDFSLRGFVEFFHSKQAACVMTHEENELQKLQKTAVITYNGDKLIDSYEEKPLVPKGNHAVPPFYCYRAADVERIGDALVAGVSADAPGSFAAWLAQHAAVYAYEMPGKRYDIGDLSSYEKAQIIFGRKI